MVTEHPDHYEVNPRSAPETIGKELRSCAGESQRRGVDISAAGALLGKGDEWRGPFATESTRKGQTMRGIAIIGMNSAAIMTLEAAALARTSESAAADKLADAIACAQEAMRALTGNRSTAL